MPPFFLSPCGQPANRPIDCVTSRVGTRLRIACATSKPLRHVESPILTKSPHEKSVALFTGHARDTRPLVATTQCGLFLGLASSSTTPTTFSLSPLNCIRVCLNKTIECGGGPFTFDNSAARLSLTGLTCCGERPPHTSGAM